MEKTGLSLSDERAAVFIRRWEKSGAAERANYQLFLSELCDLLGVARPEPAGADVEANAYVFERDVTFANHDGTSSVGRIDLYKRGAFVLEAKQGSGPPAKKDALLLSPKKLKRGTAVRGGGMWDEAMVAARGQAEQYVRALPASEGNPPFVLVTDVGHTIEVYADFSRLGKTYVPFLMPGEVGKSRTHRLFLSDLMRGEVRAALAAIWTDPLSLDPSRKSAKVTRDVADQLARLAKLLEKQKNPPELVASFLMRCLFTLFAEDVKLIKYDAFTKLLESLKGQAQNFKRTVPHVWREMDTGSAFNPVLRQKLLKFNGGLFEHADALDVGEEGLQVLIDAGKSDWSDVEPAIFGTLLERALDPMERHKLGAHYTPRAYVERLVLPTVIEPLREDFGAARAAAFALAGAGKNKEAVKVLHDYLHQLCTTKVLDPACGSGNFLYVTLWHMKAIEREVRDLLVQMGDEQMPLEIPGQTVHPEQFYGLEINPRAAVIADLVLWIGYLQWHFRTHAGAEPAEPVLRDLHNIKEQDAVLAYDSKELLRDEAGKPVTRWDGLTMKKHPVTGEDVPDEKARVAVYRYVNPRKAEWPKADYVVGNPPFIGNKYMRYHLGDEYVDALRNAHADLSEAVDFVMFWWDAAATLAQQTLIRRFGFITTNSITQAFNRRVIDQKFNDQRRLHFVFAIPDHPWVDSTDGAAVRIAMTVVSGGKSNGPISLGAVSGEQGTDATDGSVKQIELATQIVSAIHSDLSSGANVTSAEQLRSNIGLANMGVTPLGDGFRISKDDVRRFGYSTMKLPDVIKPYIIGRDLVQDFQERYIIDFYGLTKEESTAKFPQLMQHVVDTVKPARDLNKRESRKKNWWLFGETGSTIRPIIFSIQRYIATCQTAKHRIFTFLESRFLPDQKIVNIGLDGSNYLGVLSSRIHLVWAEHTGSMLEDRPCYNHTLCFNTFPFPNSSDENLTKLGDLLDAHRKSQQKQNPDLSLTDMYNVLEKLRSGEALTAKEKKIHDAGLVSVLKQIHDELDAAVFEAYGWPATLSDEEILERLVALNHERAEEERAGLVRWLRPEFQNPQGAGKKEKQGELGLKVKEEKKMKAAGKVKKTAWPKGLAERAKAVRGALVGAGGPMGAKEVAGMFMRADVEVVEELLDTLVSLGQAREVEEGRYVG